MKRSRERKSNRLKKYDYSTPGWYFVTICVKDMDCVFGNVVDGKMVLNDLGMIAIDCWLDLPNHYKNCKLDEVIFMPNHIHGIVIIEYVDIGTGLESADNSWVGVGTGLKPVPTENYKIN